MWRLYTRNYGLAGVSGVVAGAGFFSGVGSAFVPSGAATGESGWGSDFGEAFGLEALSVL